MNNQDENYDQRTVASCSYHYNPPPQQPYATSAQNNYYKDYIPETVEYTQLPEAYGYANSPDDVKSEPREMSCIQEPGDYIDLLPHNLMGYTDVEKYKLERKRERNRIAASKCRMRKLERIAQLDEEVRRLKAEKEELGEIAERLRSDLKKLQSQLQHHVENGCNLQNSNFSCPDSTC
ncbi:transcription factor AP-1 [Eurytemora carolleeae]|uniref:transcription factor AP-1 n=1 Tax=Eurytemora carolleeae TaxID=1294199 RepID=UPI000C78AE07|nr:transcription factor AP-1 [Eurytemora carolleeae]|eukprot:XP_023345765.1 transcription factor AP-1-like [Eurytemora affinis]